jgi:hypothetical protein
MSGAWLAPLRVANAWSSEKREPISRLGRRVKRRVGNCANHWLFLQILPDHDLLCLFSGFFRCRRFVRQPG